MSKVLITGEDLTVEEIVAVCRQEALVELSDEAKENVRASRKIVDDLIAEEKVVYGITTGFGKFSDVVISQDQCKELQKNLIITHAVGAGEPFSRDIARGIMLLRINNLSKGFSGIRLETHLPPKRRSGEKHVCRGSCKWERSAELGTGRNRIVHHQKVQPLFAMLRVDGGDQHPAALLAHHLSGRQVHNGHQRFAHQLLGLVVFCNAG